MKMLDRFMSFLFSKFSVQELPPYRRVVNRTHEGNDEIVTLECGHRFRLVAHRRASWPCEECRPVKSELRKAVKVPDSEGRAEGRKGI